MKKSISIITLSVSLMSSFAQAEVHDSVNSSASCLANLNATYAENGAPFDVPNKEEILKELIEYRSELSQEEEMLVIQLLERLDTEVYIPYDSADAGLYLHIVDKKNCGTLWTGFVFNA